MMWLLSQSTPKPEYTPRASLKDISRFAEQGDPTMNADSILLMVGALLILIGLLGFYRWWRTRHERSTPLYVFWQAARKLNLTWQDQYLLWRIAQLQRLPSPLTLLFCASTLQHHAQQYARRCTVRRGEQVLNQTRSIERRVFG